jgi:serine/threonine protein kinase/class 3 adenylate cyclase
LISAPNSRTGQSASIQGLDVYAIRCGSDGIVYYANSPLLRYLGIERSKVVGHPISSLTSLLGDSFHAVMGTPDPPPLARVNDVHGNVFEVRVTSTPEFRDIVLHDVTSEQVFRDFALRYLPGNFEELSEEDRQTFRFPERRFMTVTFTDLRGFTALAEAMSPEAVRETINAYLEEVIAAIRENGATLDKIVGDEVMALYGAPKYYADHAFRAVKTACDQMAAMRRLQDEFRAASKTIPLCGISVHSGEMIVGNIGSTTNQSYTVMGAAVNLASRLCAAAHAGEILMTEATFREVLSQMPAEWEAIEATTEDPYEVGEITSGKIDEVLPLEPEQERLAYLIGPGVSQDPDNAEFHFYYACRMRARGLHEPVTVISVVAAKESTSNIELQGKTLSVSGREKIFGKYRLIEIIGRGGMGEVWKARDQFGNVVAIKMLLAGMGASDFQIARFRREAEAMARLAHRNICRIHEVGEVEGRTFIAMEFAPGATLADILAVPIEHSHPVAGALTKGDLSSLIEYIHEYKSAANLGVEGVSVGSLDLPPDSEHGYHILPVQQTLAIIIKVCDAIQFAHQHGIIHRDLKPANVMIRPDGEPLVMDFGLAKVEQDARDMTLSFTGQIVGTIEYMAPEQARSMKESDERTDVYSIGAVLYQMIAGRKHFKATGNLLDDAQRLQEHAPASIRQINRAIDEDLDIITLKALRPDRSERYRSVAALVDDLNHYRRGEVISAKPVSTRELAAKWIKRNRAIFALSVFFLGSVLVLVIAFIVSLYQGRERAEAARVLAEASEVRAIAESKRTQEALAEVEEQKRKVDQALAVYEAEKAAKGEAIQRATEAEKRAKLSDVNRKRLATARENLAQRTPAGWDEARRAIAGLEAAPVERLLFEARLQAAAFRLEECLATLAKAAERSGDRDLSAEYLLAQAKDFQAVIAENPKQALKDEELRKSFAACLLSSTDPDDRLAGSFLYAVEPSSIPTGSSKPKP